LKDALFEAKQDLAKIKEHFKKAVFEPEKAQQNFLYDSKIVAEIPQFQLTPQIAPAETKKRTTKASAE